MARGERKTVRFSQIVERSGAPHAHTLWLPPDKDPELQRAQKAHRVMTIESSSTGSKTDVGIIGFNASSGKPAQYLIFPKSLKAFEGSRVVGIKFDLVAQPKLVTADRLKHAATSQPPRGRGKATAKPLPARKGDRPGESPERAAPELQPPASIDPQVVPFELPDAEPERKPEPTPSRSKPRPSARTPTKPKDAAPKHPVAAAQLIREVRAAMQELKRGKSVAAYQRLERAVGETK